MTREMIKWKLFPFSLNGEVKQWFTNAVGSVNGDWEELRDIFCLAFFPSSYIHFVPRAIRDFEQNEKESIGAAWARFSKLILASPDLSVPRSLLLQLFFSGLDTFAALSLDKTAGGSFIQKSTTEQRKILDHILEKHASPVVKPKPLQDKGMSSFEEPSSAESLSSPSLDSSDEPSPEPRTPEERILHPSEFPIKFEDYCNTSNLSWHRNRTTNKVLPRVKPSKEWLLEVTRSSEAIQILSPSMTIPCSLKGTFVEALHNHTVETNIMSQFLAETLLGNIPLVSTNKLFKSPSGLIFECCGIARAVPLKIEEREVCLDFHIYAILDFELLIGYPLKKLFKETSSHGSLDEELGVVASTTPILCSKSLVVEQQPNNDPFKEDEFIPPFVSHDCETKHPSSASLEPKPCPSSHENIVLNTSRESMLIHHEKSQAMDMHEATTLGTKQESTNEHVNFSFETSHVSCSPLGSL